MTSLLGERRGNIEAEVYAVSEASCITFDEKELQGLNRDCNRVRPNSLWEEEQRGWETK